MTDLLNWIALIAFAAGAIYAARWVVQQGLARWKGPDTALGFAFFYVMTLATITGLSFVVASVLYYEILFQPGFMTLTGLPGAIKFLLIFAGLWYAALYAFKRRDEIKGDPKP